MATIQPSPIATPFGKAVLHEYVEHYNAPTEPTSSEHHDRWAECEPAGRRCDQHSTHPHRRVRRPDPRVPPSRLSLADRFSAPTNSRMAVLLVSLPKESRLAGSPTRPYLASELGTGAVPGNVVVAGPVVLVGAKVVATGGVVTTGRWWGLRYRTPTFSAGPHRFSTKPSAPRPRHNLSVFEGGEEVRRSFLRSRAGNPRRPSQRPSCPQSGHRSRPVEPLGPLH